MEELCCDEEKAGDNELTGDTGVRFVVGCNNT
jgi:hypothetical protein